MRASPSTWIHQHKYHNITIRFSHKQTMITWTSQIPVGGGKQLLLSTQNACSYLLSFYIQRRQLLLLISIHRQLVYKEIQKTCRNFLKPRKKMLLTTDSLVIPFEDGHLVYKEIQRTCRHFLKPRKKMLPAIDSLVIPFAGTRPQSVGSSQRLMRGCP